MELYVWPDLFDRHPILRDLDELLAPFAVELRVGDRLRAKGKLLALERVDNPNGERRGYKGSTVHSLAKGMWIEPAPYLMEAFREAIADQHRSFANLPSHRPSLRLLTPTRVARPHS